MKKYLFVMIAAVMAIGISAFTGKEAATYWIRPGTDWLPITEEQACPAGSMTPCVVDNPYTPAVNDPTPVYITQSPSNPLRRPN